MSPLKLAIKKMNLILTALLPSDYPPVYWLCFLLVVLPLYVGLYKLMGLDEPPKKGVLRSRMSEYVECTILCTLASYGAMCIFEVYLNDACY